MRALRRIFNSLALALLLAGCDTGPVPDAPQMGQLTAHFWQAHDDEVIEVQSLNRLALRTVVLVLPDGTEVPAYSIDTEANPTTADLGVLSAVATPPTGSTALPTNGNLAGGGQDHTTMVGAIAGSALIRVPEMATYRTLWQKARIDITLGVGADTDRRSLPAPPPT